MFSQAFKEVFVPAMLKVFSLQRLITTGTKVFIKLSEQRLLFPIYGGLAFNRFYRQVHRFETFILEKEKRFFFATLLQGLIRTYFKMWFVALDDMSNCKNYQASHVNVTQLVKRNQSSEIQSALSITAFFLSK